MKRLVGFDFGNLTVDVAEGFKKIERVYTTPRYIWINDIRHTWREQVKESLLSDFVWDTSGEFRVGLPKGNYKIKMKFYDPIMSYGPFTISVGSVDARSPIGSGEYTTIFKDMQVTKNILIEKEFSVKHIGGALGVNFSCENEKTFMVNSLEIYADEDTKLEIMFEDAPCDLLPSKDELKNAQSTDIKKTFKDLADWLLSHRSNDGFLGDFEGEMRIWYTSSYPIRTLLAAYDIFGDKKYLEASTDILDRLVSEQMPDGAFTQSYRNQATNTLSKDEIQKVRNSNWMNLADIGSIVAALAAACKYVDDNRRKKYIDILKNYCDNWAMRFQDPSGGFLNGWLNDHYAEWVYNVSTATTALAFAIFSKISGERKYLLTAEKAVDFLIKGWNDDGRPLSAPHDYCSPGKAWYQNVLSFGDLFYIDESLAVVSRHSENMDLRKRVYDVARKHLFGSDGLLVKIENETWWPLDDTWINSKGAAMPMILLDFLTVAEEFGASSQEINRVKTEYDKCKKFLCVPEFSRRLGIMVEDPELPWGGHSVQSWTGCAVAATGLAGISLAEMIEAGITYIL